MRWWSNIFTVFCRNKLVVLPTTLIFLRENKGIYFTFFLLSIWKFRTTNLMNILPNSPILHAYWMVRKGKKTFSREFFSICSSDNSHLYFSVICIWEASVPVNTTHELFVSLYTKIMMELFIFFKWTNDKPWHSITDKL